MYLKLFLFAIVLNCVVLSSCEEEPNQISLEQATNEEIEIGEIVDSFADDYSDISVPLKGSFENIESTIFELLSDISTTTTLIETEVSANVTDDLAVTLTVDDNSITNATDSTIIEGELTEILPEDLATNSKETVTESSSTSVIESSSTSDTESSSTSDTESSSTSVTEGSSTSVTESISTSDTEISSTSVTESISEKSTVLEASTESSTTTTTTELPTTPIDLLCPQVPETSIDPKYRNVTFDLYFEEFMRKNPLATVYKSPGFPGPYAANLNCTLSLTLSNCTGIDVVVHYLDLNPFQPDTLNIRGGEENASNEKGKKLTGFQLNVAFKIIHTTSLLIWFNSGPFTEDYQGFLLTYSPYGNDTPPITTTESPVTIPPTELQIFEVQLIIPEASRTNETWHKFKEVLASSASKYVTEQNFNYELAHPDNVTIDVFNCPNNWPHYETCVRVQFSIALWSLDYDPDVHFDLSIFEYELSSSNLSVMWDLYGRDDFAESLGIEEYFIPDGTYILLLWTGVSLTIVVIFIGVLYSIWRIDIFREYRRMHTKSDDRQDILKEKSELDISMYPIPHQPYPTLFETNEMNTGGYYDSYEINSTSFQGHTFHHDIHQEKSNLPINYRHGTNHFSPSIVDFNDAQLFPDDEEDFGRIQTVSPRSKQKLLVLGAKRDESNS